jgi:hypothetical protein
MNDIIDGNMRFIVDETNGDLRLYPYQSIALKRKDIHFTDYRIWNLLKQMKIIIL